MRGKASLVYKCRCCGVFFRPVHVPDGYRMFRVLEHGEIMPPAWGVPPMKIEPHTCDAPEKKTMGVADFVGVEFD